MCVCVCVCVCMCVFYMKVCEHLLPETAASVCRCHLLVTFVAERLKQEVKAK